MSGVVTRVRGDALARPVVPADGVVVPGSVLDPHVGPACAAPQVPRTGPGCELSEQVVRTLVTGHTDIRAGDLLGESSANVPQLERELERDARR